MNARILVVLLAAAVATPSFAAPKGVSATRTKAPARVTATARIFPLAENAFPVPIPRHIAAAIREAATHYGVDPNLVASMAFRESRFDPNAVSRHGAVGVMQLKPRTAAGLGVKNSYDARDNIFGGAKYLKEMLDRFNGDVDLSLAAYNAGPELVAQKGPTATHEAVAYVRAVKAMYTVATRAF
jgi:soluble lytic murein transglycosylase-like protein